MKLGNTPQTCAALIVGVIAVLGLTESANAQGGEWMDLGASGLGSRHASLMAYNSARNVMVLWGGNESDTYRNDTWEWDGTSWTMVHPGGEDAPQPNVSGAMVYDSWHNEVAMFTGGVGGQPNEYYGDMWVWDGQTWTIVTPNDPNGVTAPSPRWSPGMAFDSHRGKVVLFGGNIDNTMLSDTWEWDGATATWEQISPASTHPSARSIAAMSFDPANEVTLLFGGSYGPPDIGEPTRDNQTWAWDGVDWELVDDGTNPNGPRRRNGHSLAYDFGRGRTVLFGGWNGAGYFYPETWEWDGDTWRLRLDSGPGGRVAPAMAYDILHSDTVLFGGYDNSGTLPSNTWTLRGRFFADYNEDGEINFFDIQAVLQDFSDGTP